VKKKKFLGKHLDKVACQTCHIPRFAIEAPTKTWWDWSDAGKDRESKKDENGKPTFAKKKGSFTWEKNVTPVYAWYNGNADVYLLGDKMDPSKVTSLSWPKGDRRDEKAKIFPFKLMRGKQPYDTKNKTFITPKLFGKTGFWKTFDWNSASEQGMAAAGLDYSGSYDFAETEMYWKLNHMVSPKDDALKCKACHSEGGLMDWQALGYPGDPKKKENRD